MREIKFRAWDKEEKYMIYPGDCPRVNPKNCGKLIYCDMETVGIGLNGELYLIDECGNYEYVSQYKKEGFILMQYTGLCDRNGKEIYEGDIIKTPIAILTIGYYTGNYCGFDFKEVFGLRFCLDAIEYLKVFEVIGNIYENPELSDSEKK